MAEIIDNIHRNKLLNNRSNLSLALTGRDPKDMSDDELKMAIANLQQSKSKSIADVGMNLGDTFLQRGGITPPKRDTGNDLNDFMMKEMIRSQIRTKPSVEKPKSIKEQAFEAISKNETLPGLSVEETKKVAGVYIPGAKLSAAAEKRGVEESKLAEELGGLLNSFTRAKEEAVKSIPKFGARGIQGRIAGISAGAAGSMGYLPATNVYNKQRKAFATVVAKAAGEVRPTDEDIRRFVQTLPDTGKSDEENALLIADIQDKVSKGGIPNLWFSQKNSNIPTQAGQGQGDEYGLYLQSIGAQ